MLIVLLVGVGGFAGAIMRYLVGGWVSGLLGNPAFPYGTMTVNVLGCALIGLLAGVADTSQVLNAEVRALLLIGLLGGFTTFSAFGYQTIILVRDGELVAGLANVGLQVFLGLLATWIAYRLSVWASSAA